MTPAVLNTSPGGRSVLNADCIVYGAVPPAAVRVAEYVAPTMPFGNQSGVSDSADTASGKDATVIDCPAESVTTNEKRLKPSIVGTPAR